MDAVPFPQQNFELKAPGNMPECLELPAYSSVVAGYAEEEGAFFLSKWRLTTAEIAELQETGTLWLYVWGGRHPPVALSTQDPFRTQPPQ